MATVYRTKTLAADSVNENMLFLKQLIKRDVNNDARITHNNERSKIIRNHPLMKARKIHLALSFQFYLIKAYAVCWRGLTNPLCLFTSVFYKLKLIPKKI